MKKFILFLILPIFCLNGCQEVEEPAATTELKYYSPSGLPQIFQGKVKSFTMKSYLVSEEDGEFIKGELIGDSLLKVMGWAPDYGCTFDENGTITLTETLSENGVTSYREIVNENGVVTSATRTTNDTARTHHIVHGDEHGFIVKVESFNPAADTLINTYNSINNERGDILEYEVLAYDGAMENRYVLEYDESGRVTEIYAYDSSDSMIWGSISEYGEDGLLSGSKYLNKDGELRVDVALKLTKFDEKGNWLWQISWEDGVLTGMDERTFEYYD